MRNTGLGIILYFYRLFADSWTDFTGQPVGKGRGVKEWGVTNIFHSMVEAMIGTVVVMGSR